MNERRSGTLEAELRGRTLEVYWALLSRREPVGVREIQRALRLSSPSVAFHHLEKLLELGVVEKDSYGRYVVAKKVDVGVLQAFLRVGGRLLPRFLFYALFFTTLLTLYLAQTLPSPDPYAATFGVAAVLASWYETIRVWRTKPL